MIDPLTPPMRSVSPFCARALRVASALALCTTALACSSSSTSPSTNDASTPGDSGGGSSAADASAKHDAGDASAPDAADGSSSDAGDGGSTPDAHDAGPDAEPRCTTTTECASGLTCVFLVADRCAAQGRCVELGSSEAGCPAYGQVCGCNGEPVAISGCNTQYAFGPVAPASATEPDGGCIAVRDAGDGSAPESDAGDAGDGGGHEHDGGDAGDSGNPADATADH